MRKATGLQQAKNEDAAKYAKRVEEIYEQFTSAMGYCFGLKVLREIMADNGMTIDRFFAKELINRRKKNGRIRKLKLNTKSKLF